MRKINEAQRNSVSFLYESPTYGETFEVYIINADVHIFVGREEVEYLDEVLPPNEVRILQKVIDSINTMQLSPSFSNIQVG